MSKWEIEKAGRREPISKANQPPKKKKGQNELKQ
jgi:hypothetical protein